MSARPTDIPDPDQLHPTTRADLTNVVFLKNEVTSPLIEVGDYTYYDNEGTRPPFEQANIKYLYGPQRLVIGHFTTIGPGVTFLMPGGNHPMVGPSTYPFTMFGGAWTANTLDTYLAIPQPGDTVVGNDVWIGREATILPGVTIGDGAVIGAHSVVTKDVRPYEIVAGNPARHIRLRFAESDIARLLAVRWWDWPIEKITTHAATIMAGTPEELERLAAS
ncbi:MAG TPA: CatB-related O-acetyltransferase [Natronosporangium sp.]|nr:CatB-related O-acetyltransferase [Natronosporangium sp.]